MYWKSNPAGGLSLEFEIWRLTVITDLISWLITFYQFLVSRLLLLDEANVEFKCHGVCSD